MNTAEWILVAILSVTLFVFLIIGIVLLVRLISLSKEVEKVIVEGQDIAKNANGIVSNVKGMTSIGGTVELFVDKYINSKLKDKPKEEKEKKDEGKE
jgi:biopolymer transport protein ExbB/TolQ